MQDTISAPVVAEPKVGRVARIRRRAALVMLTMALFTAGGIAPSFASTTDLTNGAGDTFFSTITSYFTANVLPKVLILLALMVGVGVLIKWGRRAAKSS